MRIKTLLEAPQLADRRMWLQLQTALLDNEYGVDLEVKLTGPNNLHVTLPNFVDELIWSDASIFMARSGHQRANGRSLGTDIKTAVQLFLPEAFALKLKHELYTHFAPRHDVYTKLQRLNIDNPVMVMIEWDDVNFVSNFHFSAKDGYFYTSDDNGKRVPIRTVDEAVKIAKSEHMAACLKY